MTSIDNILNQQNPQKPKKTLVEKLNMARNIFMACAFLIMGAIMIFPEKLGADFLLAYTNLQRYLFGGICLLYGGFRIFRAFVQSNY
jgi:hypothetical protein